MATYNSHTQNSDTLHIVGVTSVGRRTQKALSRIKPKFRIVLVLKDIEGLSYEEAAQAVGCSQGTISSRLNRGRKELKTLLVKMGMDEEYFQER